MKKHIFTLSAVLLGLASTEGRADGAVHAATHKADASHHHAKIFKAGAPVYIASVGDRDIRSRNRFAGNSSRGNAADISFTKKQNNKFAWGLDYLYLTNETKGQTFSQSTGGGGVVTTNSQGNVSQSTSNSIVPYGVYQFTPDFVGSIFAGFTKTSTKITQTQQTIIAPLAPSPTTTYNFASTGKVNSTSKMIGTNLSYQKTYGIFVPAVNGGLFYSTSKSNQFGMTNGGVINAKRFGIAQGNVGAQLTLNVPFLPYVKVGSERLLKRTGPYAIQGRTGWKVGGGIKIPFSQKWFMGIDYERHKSPTGVYEKLWMAKLTTVF